MKVIIATSNQDKFIQISNILTSLKINSNEFVNLTDLNITNDEEETGSIMDRAKQKALNCLSKLSEADYSKYLCIVSNDTGTSLPTLNIKTAESKKIASQILSGELLKTGDPINYVYSYAFILLPSKKMLTAEAEIPFTYLGNPKNLVLTEGQNTMNLVKALPGQTVPHSEISQEEVIKYRLTYLENTLKPIIETINNQSNKTD
jgi:hypothetical protein